MLQRHPCEGRPLTRRPSIIRPQNMPPPPSASTNTVTVQADWHNREFVQAVQLGVAHLTSFLNTFGVLASTSPRLNHKLTLPLLLPDADDVTRGKLSHLDSKLAKLERRMEVIEGTLQSVSHEKAFCK